MVGVDALCSQTIEAFRQITGASGQKLSWAPWMKPSSGQIQPAMVQSQASNVTLLLT